MSKNVPIALPKNPAWLTQVLVIRALLGREVVTRFGKYRLGLLWLLVEPLFSVIIIGVIFGPFMGRKIAGMPYAFLILNGLMILKLFVNPMVSGMNAINANQGLLVYPSVKVIDPFLARYLFDFLSVVISFTLFCIVAAWIGIQLSLNSLHILAAGFFLTWLCGCGLGLIAAVGAAYFSETEKLVGIIQRPMFLISAVMYSTAHLPHVAQKVLFFNPVVHTVELCRQALFPFYTVKGANLAYPSVFAIVVLSIGLMLFRNHRNHLAQQ